MDYVFHDNPQASDVSTVTDALYGNHVAVSTTHDGTIKLPTTATYCVRECEQVCTSQVWTVTFNAVDFGTCNSCNKIVGLHFYQRKNTLADVENWDDDRSAIPWTYGGPYIGTVTGANLAAAFAADFNSLFSQMGHDLFLATITVVGAVVTISIGCPLKLDNIIPYKLDTLAAGEAPVVVKVTEGLDNFLTRDYMRLKYPPVAFQPLVGAYPSPADTWCQNVCVVTIMGCFPSCTQGEVSNTLDGTRLTSQSVNSVIELILNKNAAGYAAFIGALNAQITGCAMPTTTNGPGFTPLETVDGTVVAGTLTLTPASIPNGSFWTVQTSAGIGIGPTAAIVGTTGTAIAAALTAIYPAGTFTGNATDVTFTGTIAGGTFINLTRVSVP